MIFTFFMAWKNRGAVLLILGYWYFPSVYQAHG